MPEFKASQARAILESEKLLLDHWYSKFKDYVFDYIIAAIKNGNNQITILSDKWENDDKKKRYLLNRLDQLGYEVKVNGDMTIQW